MHCPYLNFLKRSLITGFDPLGDLDKLYVFGKILLAGFSCAILVITDIICKNIELDVVCVYVSTSL